MTASSVISSSGSPVTGLWSTPARANKTRRYWATSVTVATVDLEEPRVTRCSMATVGGRPVKESMSGFGNCSTNWRAYAETHSRKRRWPSEKRISKAKDDLPEPDTPVITVREPCGISSETSRRLCSRAPRKEMLVGRGLAVRVSGVANAASPAARKFPVVVPALATCAGVPSATSRPPPGPASGPISKIQSQALSTSRWCSTTMSEWPASARRWSRAIKRATSSRCRPVVGSSSSNKAPGLRGSRRPR